ncbi:MAG: hypothetical protein F6K19_40420 [Cyanothece sp. SIO1E1]|nr:hypothetical protein [Cyanothece sp. SIO1E1]
MAESTRDPHALQAEALITQYGFDLGQDTAIQLLKRWLVSYGSNWIRLAIIEALYQGRYKAVSVQQILVCWHRRGHPLQHFSHEFERIICSKFPIRELGQFERSADIPATEMPNDALGADRETAPGPMLIDLASPSSEQSQPNSVSAATRRTTAPALDETTLELLANLNHQPVPSQPTPAFHPEVRLDSPLPAAVALFGHDVNKEPIHQFVPTMTASEFHEKLKTVVRLSHN